MIDIDALKFDERGLRLHARVGVCIQFFQQLKPRGDLLVRQSARRHKAVHDKLRGIGIAACNQRRMSFREEAQFGEPSLGGGEDGIGRYIALVGLSLHHCHDGADGRIDLSRARQPPRLHEIGGRFMPKMRMRHRAHHRIEIGAGRQFRQPFVDKKAIHIRVNGLPPAIVVMGGVRLGVKSLKL